MHPSIMNNKWQLLLLVCLYLYIRPITAQNYIKNKQKFCQGVDYTDWQYTDDERIANRKSIKALVPIKFAKLYAFVQNGKAKELITGMIAYLAIIGVLLVVSIASFIVYFLYCCCFKQYQSSSPAKIKVFCLLASVFGVLFILCVIMLIVFIAALQKNYNASNCAISKTPYDILEGVKFSDKEYMGLRNLKQTLVNFSGEVTNLSDQNSNFNSISDARLTDAGSQATNAFAVFVASAKDTKVKDGLGASNTPNTITSFNTDDGTNIAAEFKNYSDMATDISSAADKGKTYGNSATVKSTVATLKTAGDTLGLMITSISANLDTISTYMASGKQYFSVGYYIALALSLFILIFAAVMIFILYCQFAKNRCFGMACPLKVFMVFVALANTALILISVGVMALSAGTSSFCKYNSEVLAGSTAAEILANIDSTEVKFETNEAKFYSTCLATTAAPLVVQFPGDELLTNASIVMNGVSRYSNFRPNLAGTNYSSATINTLVGTWQKYASGLFLDFDNVKTVLAQLNTQVKCEKSLFVINSQNCTQNTNTALTCKVVSADPNYKVPLCVDNQTDAQTYFNNLLQYSNDENKTLTNLINSLNTADTSPQSKFSALKKSLANIQNSYSTISSRMQNTMSIATQYGTGFDAGSDCSAIRETFLNLEAALCFKFNNNVFYFLVFLLAATLCVIIMNWFICITFRCIPQPDKKSDYYEMDDTEMSNMMATNKEE